jgi:hypothetical protein
VTRRRREDLLFLLNLVDMTNEDYFICGGTLLGYVRHGGFIPWDCDVDVSVPTESVENMCSKLRKAVTHVPGLRIVDTICGAVLSLTRQLEVTSLDIFVISRRPPRGLWSFAGPLLNGGGATFITHLICPSQTYRTDILFPTTRGNFAGIVVRVPRNPRRVCITAFGKKLSAGGESPYEDLVILSQAIGDLLGATVLPISQPSFLK